MVGEEDAGQIEAGVVVKLPEKQDGEEDK